jgi:8-oxo-dGTP diphosphatase
MFRRYVADEPLAMRFCEDVLLTLEKPLEPEKCARWDWIPWSQMWQWAKEQAEAEAGAKEVKKQMFLPLVNLYRDYPEMEHSLRGL